MPTHEELEEENLKLKNENEALKRTLKKIEAAHQNLLIHTLMSSGSSILPKIVEDNFDAIKNIFPTLQRDKQLELLEHLKTCDISWGQIYAVAMTVDVLSAHAVYAKLIKLHLGNKPLDELSHDLRYQPLLFDLMMLAIQHENSMMLSLLLSYHTAEMLQQNLTHDIHAILFAASKTSADSGLLPIVLARYSDKMMQSIAARRELVEKYRAQIYLVKDGIDVLQEVTLNELKKIQSEYELVKIEGKLKFVPRISLSFPVDGGRITVYFEHINKQVLSPALSPVESPRSESSESKAEAKKPGPSFS